MGKEKGAKWNVLIIGIITAIVFVIDSAIMSVSISTLVVDLNTTASGVQLAIALYTLIMGSLLLLGGKLQDILGRKKTFIIGTVLFAIGAFITVISVNLAMLILGWSVIEGIGAALMLPSIITALYTTYHGKERINALGYYGAAGAIAAASGPIVGGFLSTYLSWRLAFTIMVVVALYQLYAARKLEETKITAQWKDLDLLGAIFSFLGLLLFLVGIMALDNPDNITTSLIIFVVAVILLIIFYLIELNRIKASKQPLIDVNLFKIRNFTFSNTTRLITNIVLAGGLVFIFPVFLQLALGLDAFMTGLALLPATVGSMIFALAVTKFADYISPRKLVTIGLVIQLMGILLLINTFSIYTTMWNLLPGIFLIGAGYGFTTSLLPNSIMSSVPSDKHNDGTAIMETVSRLGQSMGTAVIGGILFFSLFAALAPAYEASDLNTMGISEKELNTYIQKMETTPLPVSIETSQEATKLIDETVSTSMNNCMYATAILMVIAIILSIFTRDQKEESN